MDWHDQIFPYKVWELLVARHQKEAQIQKVGRLVSPEKDGHLLHSRCQTVFYNNLRSLLDSLQALHTDLQPQCLLLSQCHWVTFPHSLWEHLAFTVLLKPLGVPRLKKTGRLVLPPLSLATDLQSTAGASVDWFLKTTASSSISIAVHGYQQTTVYKSSRLQNIYNWKFRLQGCYKDLYLHIFISIPLFISISTHRFTQPGVDL